MMRTSLLLFLALTAASTASAQDLRRGLTSADAVLVGRQVGKRAHDDKVTLHRVQVLANVRGAAAATAVTVLDWPKLSLHNRPTPRQSRLFCLQDASALATRMNLPANEGPYFKMVGWAGSHPLIGKNIDADPFVRFARLLAASENGTPPDVTALALAAMALEEEPAVRTEVTLLLSERAYLRGKLSSLHWSRLVARATGETDDIPYKVALAQLCAEQRLDGLLEALAVSLGPVTDERYARCVGHIGKVLHGEAATDMLGERLRRVTGNDDRRMLLLAIGATSTRSAADMLLNMNRADTAVTAALRAHRSPRVKKALQLR